MRKLLSFLGLLVILVVFYQQILLVGCQIALYCFLPKTYSYQKIAWDKNILRIQGVTKEKNALSIDSIDLFHQDGSFHIKVVHPQCILATDKSRYISGFLLGLHRFFSIEIQNGVLELHKLRYYFSLLPKTNKKLELKLAMDPDPLYPALLTFHYYPTNQIGLSIKSQELKYLLPLMQLWGYCDKKNLSCQAGISIEANGSVSPTGYIQDINLKTIFTDVQIQHENKRWGCEQIEAELHAEKVRIEDLWDSYRGSFYIQNGSYALLSQEAEWQNRLLHVDVIITEQPKIILSGIAVNEKTAFPFILETTDIDRDQQEIKIQAAFSDLTDKSIQGSLTCKQIGKKGLIECDIQKFESRHLDWVMSCFALPEIKTSLSYEWQNCAAKIKTLFLGTTLQSVVLSHLQAKNLSLHSASNTFTIKNAQMEGEWDANTHRVVEGYCQLEQIKNLDITINYPSAEGAICAYVQGDFSTDLDDSLFLFPLTMDLVIHKDNLQVTGSILHVPFSAEAILLKPLVSLEKGIDLESFQGCIKLQELTEELYQPWLAKFLPNLTAKGKYQFKCLFDSNKVVIGVEGEAIHLNYFDKKMHIPKLSEFFLQYHNKRWGLHCPQLKGEFICKEDPYSFDAVLDGTYPQLNMQNLSLINPDISIKGAVHVCHQDMLNIKLQITEMQLKGKSLERPLLAEIDIHPESTTNKTVASLRSVSLPINKMLTLTDGTARLDLDSHTNQFCVTQGNMKICDDKTCYHLQVDSLIGAMDFLTDVHFVGSLHMEEKPIVQAEGIYRPGIDNWRVDCNLNLTDAEIGPLQLSIENTFTQYHFSCLGKDIAISGQKLSSDWHIDRIQVGPLAATAVFSVDEEQLYCKSMQGMICKEYPFLASGVFNWQTHAISGQVDFDDITVKSSPFICEYSLTQGLFSKKIDLIVEDLKSTNVWARLCCYSASYHRNAFESTIDFDLPPFHDIKIPIAWDSPIIGRLAIKKMPGVIQINGNVIPGNLLIHHQLVHHQSAAFALGNSCFTLNSECNLGNAPFWVALELAYTRAGVLTFSENAFTSGIQSCFTIGPSNCNISTIKGQACGLAADLEAKDRNHLFGTLQIDVTQCASFVPFIEQLIQPLQLEANLIYQGEISSEKCTGLLQADHLRIKGFSVEKFSAGIELSPKEIQIHDFKLFDRAGSVFAKTMRCKNIHEWELWIPEVEINSLHVDHVLKKSKSFIVEGVVKDIQAQLSNLRTLYALGQCRFQSFQKDRSFSKVPLDILSKIGLDLRSLMPVEGELEFKIQQNRCYLTRLAKASSKNGRYQLALSEKKNHASYIELDGSLFIDLNLKQKKLLKVVDSFTFTIRGTLDQPKYGLVLLKD